MPLKRILSENRNFDPAAIAILLGAFDAVAAEVRLRTPAERERAANLIIRLALGRSDLDGKKLSAEVIAQMQK